MFAIGLLMLLLGLAGLFLAVFPPVEEMRWGAIGVAIMPGSVAGYQMVEVTLEVRPKRGTPFQVKRKLSGGRLGGRFEAGRSFDVVHDPADPERVEPA